MFALGLGNLVVISVFQRVSSVRSARGARTAKLIAAAGTVVLCVPLAAVAVVGAGLLDDVGSDSPILHQLFTGPVPAPIAMLVIAGLLAASLTAVSGVILATTNIIMEAPHLSAPRWYQLLNPRRSGPGLPVEATDSPVRVRNLPSFARTILR